MLKQSSNIISLKKNSQFQALKALSWELQQKRDAYCLQSVLPNIPSIYFYNEQSECPRCSVRLLVRKLKDVRTVYTVSFGEITIREYIHYCPCCNDVFTAKSAQLVKTGCNYSYDCLVEIGKLRYLQKRQIEEIEHIFYDNYNIPISSTQVRRLCYQFLLYLGKFHYLNVTRINASMMKRGGYILHIDSTCEGHKPHLLTCIDSLSGYVLYSQKISGENESELTIIFKRVKALFGIPLTAVHDMGAGITKSCTLVFPGIVQVVCHFHLLRDLGKDLFEAEYRKLQKELSNKKIYAKIRYQINMLEQVVGSQKDAQQLLLSLDNHNELSSCKLLQGILYGYILSLKANENTGDGYGFPFDRPKLRYYTKAVDIYKELEALESKNFSWSEKETSRFYEIKDVLRKVVNDKSLKNNIKKLEKKIEIFDELRQIMKIALPGENKGLNDNGNIENQLELTKMETKLMTFVDKLEKIVDEAPAESKPIKGVINQLNKYWDKIFAQPIKIEKNGTVDKIIIPQRTNNISEQFYRKLKQLFRRLHGRRHVGKDLLYIPEEIVLIENLKNNDYINDMLGSIDRLPEVFAQLDCDAAELPFEKEKLDMVVPQKILNAVKNLKPIELVDAFMKNAA